MTREEAHEYLEDVQRLITQWRHLFPEKFIKANGQAILALEQPEQKKGKWVKLEDGTWSCSLCHSWISYEQHYYARYCLYCGAEMEREE